MEKLLNLAMGAISEVFTEVVAKEADTTKKDVREMLFKKLVVVFAATSAMIAKLGYTQQDTARAMKEATREHGNQ